MPLRLLADENMVLDASRAERAPKLSPPADASVGDHHEVLDPVSMALQNFYQSPFYLTEKRGAEPEIEDA